jgi:hypothetical protein
MDEPDLLKTKNFETWDLLLMGCELPKCSVLQDFLFSTLNIFRKK